MFILSVYLGEREREWERDFKIYLIDNNLINNN